MVKARYHGSTGLRHVLPASCANGVKEDYSRPLRSVSVGIQIPLEDFEPERLMFNEPESAA